VAQNPVIIEQLIKGVMERCRERVNAAKAGGRTDPCGRETMAAGITRSMKKFHGL